MSEGARGQAGLGLYVAAALSAAVLGFGTVYLGLRAPDNRALAQAPARAPSNAAPAPAQAAQPSAGGLATFSKGHMAAFVVRKQPEAVGEIAFADAAGKPRTLADWKGKVVLLNLWATWCAPCLKEMPALDRLKAELASSDFDVVALNIDRGAPEKPRKWLADNKIAALQFLHDASGKAFVAVKSPGMPTTLLIGRDGRELGRLVGPAEWDSAEAKALVRAAVSARP